MDATWIDLTPERAAQLLENNPKNRTPRRALIIKYASDMSQGRWGESPQGISVSEDGSLMDGQHRCLAVVESGVTIRSLLVTGVPEKSRLVVDIGAAKTGGDLLAMQGVPNGMQISAISRYYLLYRQYPASIWSNTMITKTEAVAYALEKQTEFLEALSAGRMMTNGSRSISVMPYSAACLLIKEDTDCPDFFGDFVTGIQTGVGLAATDPRHVIREGQYVLAGAWRAQASIAMIIKAWNAYVTDRPTRQIRYRRDELPMPSVR